MQHAHINAEEAAISRAASDLAVSVIAARDAKDRAHGSVVLIRNVIQVNVCRDVTRYRVCKHAPRGAYVVDPAGRSLWKPSGVSNVMGGVDRDEAAWCKQSN